MYKLTVNEKQLRAMQTALELYFRIDLLQDYELSELLASKSIDLDPSLPDHNRLFDKYIERRDNIHTMVNAIFQIAKPYYAEHKRNEQALVVEDIWQVVRFQLYKDKPEEEKQRWTVDSNPPLPRSGQPLPKIERVEE